MSETNRSPQPEGHSDSARPRQRIAGDSVFFPDADGLRDLRFARVRYVRRRTDTLADS